MNNNFFPNLNTEPNNMTLNTMNMQTMPAPEANIGVTPQPQIMPEMAQMPNEGATQPINNFINEVTPNIPNVTMNATIQPPVEEPVAPVATPEPVAPNVLADIPLFANQPTEPTQVIAAEPMPESPIVNITPPLEVTPSEPMPEPLFSQPEPQNIVTPEPTPSIEIPVTVTEEPVKDEFTRVQEILKNNNINFKAYSNETNHCIIIEI